MFTKQFWKAAAERAVKTLAQSGVALLIGQETGLIGVDWIGLASVSGLAALISILTSIASSGGSTSGPSLTGAETLVYAPYTPTEGQA